jgi:prepilin-type N-terminal cleavage/methylation domain-containing protein
MKRRAFTLVEILVVIGIIVVLAGILVPLVGKAFKQAKRTRTAADLNSISIALEAYKADHGDYPRVAIKVHPAGAPAFQSTADRPNPMTGAQVLCKALLGLAPAGDASSYPTGNVNGVTVPLVHLKQDGKDGPGFATMEPTKDAAGKFIQQSKTYGPYLAIEKFKVGYPPGVTPAQDEPLLQTILDQDGFPILYFPRSPAKLNQSIANGYVALSLPTAEGVTTYDARDNLEPFRRTGEADNLVLRRLRVCFGDLDDDGAIRQGETARYDAPFVLWSAGADGKYGPDADLAPSDGALDLADVDRMDDVTTGGSK